MPALLLQACPCVPELESEKVIEPDKAASITFVHAMPDISTILLESDIFKLDDYTYFSQSNNDFLLPIGFNNIKIKRNDNSSVVLNSFLECELNQHYTVIAYGLGSDFRQNMLAINDSTDNFNPESAYLRCINVSWDPESEDEQPLVYFSLIDAVVEHSRYSNFIEISEEEMQLECYYENDTEAFVNENFTFEKGYYYTIILRGYHGEKISMTKKVEAILIKNKI